MIYDYQLKFLESLYPGLKIQKFGRKSWYEFQKSKAWLYVTGSGERSWYDLDKSNYDFLTNHPDECYLAIVLIHPSKTFVIPREKVKEIFQGQPESEYTSKSPGWMFSVLEVNGEHILKFHKGRAEFNIQPYLNNWK